VDFGGEFFALLGDVRGLLTTPFNCADLEGAFVDFVGVFRPASLIASLNADELFVASGLRKYFDFVERKLSNSDPD
jgi:hypothetical protein